LRHTSGFYLAFDTSENNGKNNLIPTLINMVNLGLYAFNHGYRISNEFGIVKLANSDAFNQNNNESD